MVAANAMSESVLASESVAISENTKNKNNHLDLNNVKIAKTGEGDRRKHGVIYLRRIPHGFYEDEMESFFSQFGKVEKLRLARSRHTGNSKGYAFIQFELEEVARIAAEAMNNYLMWNNILKCDFVEPEKVRPTMFFKGRGYTNPIPSYVLARSKHNSTKSDSAVNKSCSRTAKRLNKTKERMAALGIEFSMDKMLSQIGVKPKEEEEEDDDAEKEPSAKRVRKCAVFGSESDPIVLDPSDEEITIKVPPNIAVVIKTNKRKRCSK